MRMARKRQAEASALQLMWEKALMIVAGVVIFFHMWFTFARHFFAPENNLVYSELTKALLKVDKWLGFVLFLAAVGYLAVTVLCYPQTWHRVKAFFRRLRCREMGMLLFVVVYYVVGCMVHTGRYTNIFRANDMLLFDTVLCMLLMVPLSVVLGKEKGKKLVDAVLHGVMLFSTAFVCWALWHLFSLKPVDLPNGLQSGMMASYTFYPGVNRNIGAAIGVTMAMICLYMVATQGKILKIVYGIFLVPHVFAVLMTNSRGSYLALLVAFALVGFGCVWNLMGKKALALRIACSVMAAVVCGVAFSFVRSGAFRLFEGVTHFGELLHPASAGTAEAAASYGDAAAASVRDIEMDAARLRIWKAALKHMVSSPYTFFFGTPSSLIPEAINETLIQLQGKGGMYAHAHNAILQTGLMLGVPGMLGLVSFLVMMLVRCIRVVFGRAQQALRGGWMLPVMLAAALVVNMFEAFLLFYYAVIACLFFLICGLVIAVDQDTQLQAAASRNNHRKG